MSLPSYAIGLGLGAAESQGVTAGRTLPQVYGDVAKGIGQFGYNAANTFRGILSGETLLPGTLGNRSLRALGDPLIQQVHAASQGDPKAAGALLALIVATRMGAKAKSPWRAGERISEAPLPQQAPLTEAMQQKLTNAPPWQSHGPMQPGSAAPFAPLGLSYQEPHPVDVNAAPALEPRPTISSPTVTPGAEATRLPQATSPPPSIYGLRGPIEHDQFSAVPRIGMEGPGIPTPPPTPPKGFFPLERRGGEQAPLELEHRSPAELGGVVRPSSFGTGPVKGAERRRQQAFPEHFVPRSYFSVAGSPVESGFEHLPVYRGQLSHIYDDALDPRGFQAQAEAEATRLGVAGPAVASIAEKMIKDAGFQGYRRGNVVAAFRDVPVTAALFNERGAIELLPPSVARSLSPQEVAALPPHQQLLYGMVGKASERPLFGGTTPTFASWLGHASDWFHQKTHRFSLSLGTHAEQLAGKPLSVAASPEGAAIISTMSPTHIGEFLEGQGPYRWGPDGNTVPTGTPSLRTIRAALTSPDLVAAYEWRRLSLSALERAADGRQQVNPELLDAARAELATAHPVIDKVIAQENTLKADALQYAVDAGWIPADLAAKLDKLDQNYTPFWRDMEQAGGGAGVGSAAHLGSPIRRATGTTKMLPIRSPIETIPEYVTRIIQGADRARPLAELIALVEDNPKVAHDLGYRQVSGLEADALARRLQQAATKSGVTLTPAEAQQLSLGLSDTGMRPAGDIVTVYRGGAATHWRVPSIIADAMKGLSPPQLGFISRLLGTVSGGLRTGITANPVFAGLINTFRDQFDAAINSTVGFRPFVDGFSGFVERLQHSPTYHAFRRAGGGAGLIGSSSNSLAALPGSVGRYLEGSARAAAAERTLPQSGRRSVVNTVLHPVQALKYFSEPFEEGTRIGVFQKAKKAGLSDREAAIAQANATTNFLMHGSSDAVRALAHMTAFMNPGIQSVAQVVRTMRDHPRQAIALGLATIAVPTIGLWLANKDDDDITQLRKTAGGAGFFYLRIPEWAPHAGEIVRLPKPFVYGAIFGTGVEAMLDKWFNDDPESVMRFAKALWQQVSFNVMPTALTTARALQTNKAALSGAPIAPESTLDEQARMQAQNYTGAAARRISNLLSGEPDTPEGALGRKLHLSLGVSPAKFEYAVRALSGTLGSGFLKLVDHAIDTENAPTPQLADLPFAGMLFPRTPSSTGAALSLLREKATASKQLMQTLTDLRRHAPQRAMAFATEHQAELQFSAVYAAGMAHLAKLRQAQTAIYNDFNLSPEAKRTQLDLLVTRMTRIAQDVLDAVLHAQHGGSQ